MLIFRTDNSDNDSACIKTLPSSHDIIAADNNVAVKNWSNIVAQRFSQPQKVYMAKRFFFLKRINNESIFGAFLCRSIMMK